MSADIPTYPRSYTRWPRFLKFTGQTTLDIPAERVLTEADKAKLTDVVIMGYTPDGEMYFASSLANGGDVLWLMEQAKKVLLD
jgi:hypothetical protein